ncbi:hypothetical protein KP78_14940 [Jeotgalibacillus soli]|uniref:Enoyl-CoA hydratase n=1 Tax=Jeotgalibacillus soli TaxID=889306 RepID=A0A0C2W094_9BACL|nr:hypothetical protein KP78_14940 [Jeotgalibacillus soli]
MSYSLTKVVGPYIAKEIFFSAEPVLAAEAYQLGFVNHVVPAAMLGNITINLANQLAEGPSEAYGRIKSLINYSLHVGLEETLDMERKAQEEMFVKQEHKEGIQAFIEKRKLVFTNY